MTRKWRISRRSCSLASISSIALLLGAVGAYGQTPAFEAAPAWSIEDILERPVRGSSAHQVLPNYSAERNFFRFSVESRFGRFDVVSKAMLLRRVHEILALNEAVTANSALLERGTSIDQRGLSLERGATSDILTSQFRRNRSGKAPSSGLDLDISRRSETAHRSELGDLSKLEENVEQHWRVVASQLFVDPYSSFQPTQTFLYRVSRAKAGGYARLSLGGLNYRPLKLPGAAAGRLDAELRQLLRQLPRGDLDAGVSRMLADMGVSKASRMVLMESPNFGPRRRAEIASHIDYLRRIDGFHRLLDAVADVRTEAEAESFTQYLRVLALYHELNEPIVRISTRGGLPLAELGSGNRLIVLPVDVIFWDQTAVEVFSALAKNLAESAGTPGAGATSEAKAGHVLLLPGRVTALARVKLQALGFIVIDDYFVQISAK